jgi:hypothetical protein
LNEGSPAKLLAFVVPVRPLVRFAAADVAMTLLSATIHSVLGQTDDRWRLLLITSDQLMLDVEDDRILTRVADGALPQSAANAAEGYGDMHRKRLFGTQLAKSIGASHVMFLDADDLIHRDLVAYVHARDRQASYLTDMGWEVLGNHQRAFLRKSNFAARCGTCAVVSRNLLESTSFQGKPPDVSLPYYHHNYVGTLANAKADYFPFPAALYRTEHAANITMGMKDAQGMMGVVKNLPYVIRRLTKLALSKPYSAALQQQYGALQVPNCVAIKKEMLSVGS